MIDTIVLTLSKDMFCITQPDKFQPSAQWVLSARTSESRGITSKQNPTKKELLRGIYKPRLTLSHRPQASGNPEIMLKIELSLPKILLGNNFEELKQKDFDAVVERLILRLEEMGVKVAASTLVNAPVAAIHYSKNIVFTDGSTPYSYIKKIKETNVTLALDVNEAEYRNDGHGYKWHCNSYEVAFYDKIKELEMCMKSGKRALEKDGALEFKFFDLFQRRNKFEVLRMEVRLNKRQKIKQLFKRLDIKADLSFKGLFKVAIARKILLHYIDELERQRPALFDYKVTSDKAFFAALVVNNPDLSAKNILHLYGLKKVLEIATPRELRAMFSKQSQRSWYRLMAEAKEVQLPITQKPFEAIREQLIKFKAIILTKQ